MNSAPDEHYNFVEEDYKLLFSNMLNGFALHKIIKDNRAKPVDYEFVEVNSAFEKMTGLKRENILGKKATTVIPGLEKDSADWIGKYSEVALTGKSIELENYSTSLGKWFHVTAYSPKKGYFVTTFEDITHQKKMTEELQNKHKFVNSLINLNPDIIYIYDIINKKNLYVNNGIQKVLNYTSEELKEMGDQMISLLMHPDDLTVYLNTIIPKYCHAKNEEIIYNQYRMKHKSGNWIWLESKETIYKRQTDGSPEQVFGVIHDLTELKKSEAELDQTKSMLVSSMNCQKDTMMLSIDNNYNYLYFNKAHAETMKTLYNSQIAIGTNILDCITSDDDRKKTKEVLDCAFRGEPYYDLQAYGDTNQAYYESFFNPIFNDAHKIIGITCLSRNVTERKHMEDKLWEREKMFNEMLDNMSSGVVIYAFENDKNDFVIKEFNKSAEKIEQVKKEDVLGKKLLDIFPGVIKFGIYDVFKRVLETGQPEDFPLSFYQDEKISGWKENYIFKLPNNDIVAIYDDLTDKKKAEEIINSRNLLLEAQTNSVLDGILIVDTKGNKILQNQRCIDLWKIPSDIAASKDDARQIEFVKNRTKNPEKFVEQVIYLYNHPNETSHDEIEFKDGMILERYSAPVLDKNGNNYGRVWTFHDITEQKKAEEELKKSKEALQLKLDELEKFNKITVGRELKMIELKEKIKELESKLGKNK